MDSRARGGVAWVAVAVLLAVTAAVVVIVQRLPEDRPHARVGEVIDSYYVDDEEVDVDQARVALPQGYLAVEVSEPSDSIHFYDDREAAFDAPEGGSFVEVLAQVEDDGRFPTTVTSQKPLPTPELVLRDGSRSYPVERMGASLTFPGSPRAATVAVAGHPDDLVLDVVYDGVTQTVDLADGSVEEGQAAPLHELAGGDGSAVARPRRRSCGKPTWTKGFSSLYGKASGGPTCGYSTTRTPYVGGLGWAGEGRTWLVVDVSGETELSIRWSKYPGTYYRSPDDVPWTVRLDGEDTDPAALTDGVFSPYGEVQAVFAVAADDTDGELDLVRSYTAYNSGYRGGAPGPRTAQLDTTWSVDVSAGGFGIGG